VTDNLKNPWFDTIPGPRLQALVEKHGAALKSKHDTEDVYFAVWLEALDRAVMRRVLVGYRDLEDWDYWSNYDAGMNPHEAAVEMLTDNGWSDALSAENLLA
jgi:hypothetical protein